MIETSRCHIKRTTCDDVSDLHKLYTDVLVWRYLGGVRNQEEIERSIDSRVHPSKDYQYWTVRSKVTNHFLGSLSLTPHHDGINIEISYEFLSSYWGNGYAAETVGAFIQYAFSVLQYKRLVAETQSANASSCNMLQRLGFCEGEKVMRYGAEQIIWMIDNPGA